MTATFYLALYGAVVSTAVFAWNMWRTRNRIAVDLIPSSGAEGLGFVIIVANWSATPVQIRNVGLLYRREIVTIRARMKHFWRYRRIKRVGWTHFSLPKQVEAGTPILIAPGQSHLVHINHDALEEIRESANGMPVAADVQDGLFRRYASKTNPHL